MKNTGRTFFCLLVAVVLVLGSVAFGASKGWKKEAQELDAMYVRENGLKALLELRAADAGNLLVVARRHLTRQDQRILDVEAARKVLLGNVPLPEKYAANQALTGAVEVLSNALEAEPSLKADAKDWNYVVSLTKALEVYADNDAVAAYNEAVSSYNQRMSGSISGWIASQLMGVSAAQPFAKP